MYLMEYFTEHEKQNSCMDIEGCKCISYLFLQSPGQLGVGPTAQHCITSPRGDPNLKFEVWFLLNAYGFCTII